MLVTASWGGEDVAVEVDAECRTLEALKALLQAALPELDVEQTVLAVGGRCVADDEAVCGLEDGAVVALSPTVSARARATLCEEGHGLSRQGYLDAVQADDVRLCQLFLDAGASTPDFMLPLACGSNSLAVCKLLLDRGSPIDVDCKGTPLSNACLSGHVEVVRLLLDRGCSINQRSRRNGATALHGACSGSFFAVVQLLIARGADVDVRDDNGNTPLHMACEQHDARIVEALLDRGCSIDATSSDGCTPLHRACNCGYENVVKVLLDRGCATGERGEHAGCTPLHAASNSENAGIAKLLLDSGCSPHETCNDGSTPLHLSAFVGNVELIALFLDRGCAIDEQDNNANTALHDAVSQGMFEAAELLLDRGCRINVCNKDGCTALDLTDAALRDMLLARGAQTGTGAAQCGQPHFPTNLAADVLPSAGVRPNLLTHR